MRILVLAPQSFYIDRGTPIDVDILVRALSERGDRVDLVCYHEGEDRAYPNLTIHRIAPPGFVRNVGPGLSAKKLICDGHVYRVASRLLEENDYDVVHAGEEAVFMAMRFKARHDIDYVYDLDSSVAQQLVEKAPWLRPLARWFDAFETKAIRGALATAPVCNALADLARARGAAHVVTLHDISQLDLGSLAPSGELAERAGSRLQPDRIVLMYVGNLETYQGIDLLLEAHAKAVGRVPVDVVIAGGSESNIAKYRRMAERLDTAKRVHFIGPWPLDRLATLLAGADILTAPRIRGINTPMKVFPFLHSGKPLLVTDLPTHSQILDPRVAMLAPPRADAFADAIVTLAGDPELRERLGRAGRAFVEANHTYDAHRRRVDELYAYVERARRRPGMAVNS